MVFAQAGSGRIGITVSRKVGGAVVRNRIRRLFREAYRLTRDGLPTGLDLILIPRMAAQELDWLMESLTKLVPQAARRLHKEAKPT